MSVAGYNYTKKCSSHAETKDPTCERGKAVQGKQDGNMVEVTHDSGQDPV